VPENKDQKYQCRFEDGPAVALFYFDKGCVCHPEDLLQWLCEHHIHRATPIGGMELVRLAPGIIYSMNRLNQSRFSEI
jgi:hypothetical protein